MRKLKKRLFDCMILIAISILSSCGEDEVEEMAVLSYDDIQALELTRGTMNLTVDGKVIFDLSSSETLSISGDAVDDNSYVLNAVGTTTEYPLGFVLTILLHDLPRESGKYTLGDIGGGAIVIQALSLSSSGILATITDGETIVLINYLTNGIKVSFESSASSGFIEAHQ